MTGEVLMGGGFNGSARSQMSPGLLRQIAEQEDREARQAAEEVRKREERAEEWRSRATAAAIQDAVAAGEQFHPGMLAGRGLGHTKQEFIALASARQDHEDAIAAAREQAKFRAWQLEQTASVSINTSAPTPAELAEQAQITSRAEAYRARRRDRSETIQAARRFAAWIEANDDRRPGAGRPCSGRCERRHGRGYGLPRGCRPYARTGRLGGVAGPCERRGDRRGLQRAGGHACHPAAGTPSRPAAVRRPDGGRHRPWRLPRERAGPARWCAGGRAGARIPVIDGVRHGVIA